jgi:hypothetical protein
MRIKITSAFCLRPGMDVAVGDVVDATRQEALYAFALRRAIAVDEAADAAGSQDEQPEAVKQPAKSWGRRK